MHGICKKNYLAWNLNRMSKMFPTDFNFHPKTWVLPGDWIDFKNSFSKAKTFILKPEGLSQGKGIFLVKRLEEVNPQERYVAQEYLKDPLLIEGLKFDMRVYVLVAGCNPLRVYIHEQGLVRLATEPFVPPAPSNLDDLYMHLTNYAINKNNSKFVFNEDSEADDVGHKRSLASVYEYLQAEGFDVNRLKAEIEEIIMKTLTAVQPYLAHLYKSCQPDELSNSMCFEVLGFDVILDSKLKPWVLEVNHSPSFSTDSPLDWKVKKKIIRDALTLVNVKAKHRKMFWKENKVEIMRRALTGKVERGSKESKEEMAREMQKIRDKWENSHLGGFKKLYPTLPDNYEKFIQGANIIYTELTGTNISRIRKKDTKDSQKTQLPSKLAQKPMVRLNSSECNSDTPKNRFISFIERNNLLRTDANLENRSLISPLRDTAKVNCFKTKSLDIPPISSDLLRSKNISIKPSDPSTTYGNFLMPKSFEFSGRALLPLSLFKKVKKKLKNKANCFPYM